ncbi:MAG: biotin--[acetyl-CoA-carboxylase] ligase [Acidimicrobiales bacterium]
MADPAPTGPVWPAGNRPPPSADPWRLTWHDTVDSTQDTVVEAARRGAGPGLVVAADHQRRGRGRRGRTWSDHPGSCLLASVLIGSRLDPAEALIPLAAGLALKATVAEVGVTAGLKWPNDLVAGDDSKLGGLLCQAVPGNLVVIGLGLNVGWAGTRPEGATDLAAQRSPALRASTQEMSAQEMSGCGAGGGDAGGVSRAIRDRLLKRFLSHVDDLGRRDKGEILELYRQACVTLGREVRVEVADGGTAQGRAVAVDDRGCLVVATSAGRRSLSAGQVVHCRVPEGAMDQGAMDQGAMDQPDQGSRSLDTRSE